MLTKQDIEDLKTYTADFNKFCSDNVCGNECKVFSKSVADKLSCWRAFIELKKSGGLD
jgi:hypothetical protein